MLMFIIIYPCIPHLKIKIDLGILKKLQNPSITSFIPTKVNHPKFYTPIHKFQSLPPTSLFD